MSYAKELRDALSETHRRYRAAVDCVRCEIGTYSEVYYFGDGSILIYDQTTDDDGLRWKVDRCE